ncbi:hypothetical protein MAPG_09161 [Magnaporthiopsis poae ATCC 64411]|uniref:Uncharacterized protein n=1 Tax=Magnaporthiopsis poae (strain ATCC 64411 / 73-15) TaxID=644358 RepID=A0A0C4E982_MAGP6|nr:hypothetical protein MAPG_09161 [Magnaporthiopsis poae ATCC 64411]
MPGLHASRPRNGTFRSTRPGITPCGSAILHCAQKTSRGDRKKSSSSRGWIRGLEKGGFQPPHHTRPATRALSCISRCRLSDFLPAMSWRSSALPRSCNKQFRHWFPAMLVFGHPEKRKAESS